MAIYGWNSPQMDQLWKKQSNLDSLNLIKVLKILEEIKVYPGDSLVGYPARKAAFFVLQHATDRIQEKYLSLILNASEGRELDRDLAAMYHDRFLRNKGLPQIYGNQIMVHTITDSVTREVSESYPVYQIAESSKVDSLRRSVRMIPLAEYLELNGVKK
jgi:hypothetical protein